MLLTQLWVAAWSSVLLLLGGGAGCHAQTAQTNYKKLLVYILCYDDSTCAKGEEYFGHYAWARLLRLPQSIYFETYAFAELFPPLVDSHHWAEYDYVGTLSWKAPIKFITELQFGELNMTDIMVSAPDDADVIALVGGEDSIVSHGHRVHPNFREIWAGYMHSFRRFTARQISTRSMKAFYCNYWLARPEHVVKFIAFMKEAHSVIDNAHLIKKVMWMDPKYDLGRKERIDVAKNIFGRKNYAYHPFILERMTPFFFNSENLNIFVYKYIVDATMIKNATKSAGRLNTEEARMGMRRAAMKARQANELRIHAELQLEKRVRGGRRNPSTRPKSF